MQEQQLTLNDMKRGSLITIEAKVVPRVHWQRVAHSSCYGLPQAGAGSGDDS